MTIQTQHKSLHCQFAAERDELLAVRSFVRLFCLSLPQLDALVINDLERIAAATFTKTLERLEKDRIPSSIIIECTKEQEGMTLSFFDQGTSLEIKMTQEAPIDTIAFTPKTDKTRWNQLSLFTRYTRTP